MKLISLKFFGYNQTSQRNANIFASAINVANPYDYNPLSATKEVGPGYLTDVQEKIALGVSHEALMNHVYECYAKTGVKLYEVQREGVDLAKAPPDQLIHHHINADILWSQVQVTLNNSRYALRTPEVCAKMPYAYVKEHVCNGELMPKFTNVYWLNKHNFSWYQRAELRDLAEPLNMLLLIGVLIILCMAFISIDHARQMLPEYFATMAAEERYKKLFGDSSSDAGLSISYSDSLGLTGRGSSGTSWRNDKGRFWFKLLGTGWIENLFSRWDRVPAPNRMNIARVELAPGPARVVREYGGGSANWQPPRVM